MGVNPTPSTTLFNDTYPYQPVKGEEFAYPYQPLNQEGGNESRPLCRSHKSFAPFFALKTAERRSYFLNTLRRIRSSQDSSAASKSIG